MMIDALQPLLCTQEAKWAMIIIFRKGHNIILGKQTLINQRFYLEKVRN